jgi:ATP-dependent Clp protease protease subunit
MKNRMQLKMLEGRQFSMKAAGDSAEILIYEMIGQDFWSGEGVTAKGFADQLKALGDVKTINVRINSPGGDVFDGVAIYNQLANHPAIVNVAIDGLAASIASIIALAGDKITIAENALMMIHNPWSFAIGEAGDMRKMADTLDKIRGTLLGTYAARTGIDEKKLGMMMDEETWMDGKEAVKLGFADEVSEAKKIAAKFDLSCFNKAPQITEVEEENEEPVYESSRRRLALFH